MKSDLIIKIRDRQIKLSLPGAILLLYLARRPFLTFGKYFHITAPIAGLFILLFTAAFLSYTIGGRKVCLDGIFLISAFALFFAVTIIVHPEYANRYKDIYKDGLYSAVNVFTPWAGIYCYYFVRLFRDSEDDLYRTMKVLAVIILLFEIWGFLDHSDVYNMGFGYRMEMAAILFTTQYLYERKKVIYLALSGLCLLLALLYGSRASLLGYVFFLLVFMIWDRRLNLRTLFFIGLILFAVFLFGFKPLLTAIYQFLRSHGLQSRTLFKLTMGSGIGFSPSRTKIMWPTLTQKLAELPWYSMYGAFGDRTLIATKYPYAHNFVLEIMLTFGKILGTIFLLWIFVSFFLILRYDRSVRGLMTVIFGSFSLCRLFFSSSFWSEHYFWALLALFVNFYLHRRKCTMEAWRKHIPPSEEPVLLNTEQIQI